MTFPSEDELPKLTKANLAKVGIEVRDETAAHWMERGWLLLRAHLARQAMFEQSLNELRKFEEDGA